MSEFQYTAVFEPAEEGGYTVTVPALPGLVTEGDTFEEARSMVEEAIRGMLPKTKLGRAMFHKLKVYPGDAHPHQAQKPRALTVKARRER